MKRHAVQGWMPAAFLASVTCWSVVLEAKGQDPKKDAIKKELGKLEGSWKLVSREAKGKKTAAEDLKDWHLTIKGDQWTQTYPGGVMQGTMRIDPGKDPKTMDLTFQAPGRKIPTRGIYALGSSSEGDTLTLCRVSQPGLPRPKEFKTTDKAGLLFVWKRATE